MQTAPGVGQLRQWLWRWTQLRRAAARHALVQLQRLREAQRVAGGDAIRRVHQVGHGRAQRADGADAEVVARAIAHTVIATVGCYRAPTPPRWSTARTLETRAAGSTTCYLIVMGSRGPKRAVASIVSCRRPGGRSAAQGSEPCFATGEPQAHLAAADAEPRARGGAATAAATQMRRPAHTTACVPCSGTSQPQRRQKVVCSLGDLLPAARTNSVVSSCSFILRVRYTHAPASCIYPRPHPHRRPRLGQGVHAMAGEAAAPRLKGRAEVRGAVDMQR